MHGNATPLIAGFEPFVEHGRPGEVGFSFRISIKKLGRNLKKLHRSPALQGALRLADKAMKNPVLSQAIPPQYRLGIAAGVAALKIKDKADAGDPGARKVVSAAESNQYATGNVVASTDAVPPPPGMLCPCCGQVMQ
jgi:hypothetical protein